ncbi:MAG: phosphonate metabolism transcriptional regulator PhnF [Rhizobiaceae bacterium]|nr:phosphonate metabolism transcriptional regulator PhnF [Rhizobiaceae bacterium]
MTPGKIQRRSGVALWRQIADRMRQLVSAGAFGETGKLPPELLLAEQFGVNRHTVRSAIALLVQEGVLRSEQGRGTFVQARPRLSYPIGMRTRFSDGLAGQTQERIGVLISSQREPAGTAVAQALGIPEGAPLIRLETRAEADGRPLMRSTSWFDAIRFAGIDDSYAATGSITAALKELGIEDYTRQSTTVTAQLADIGDLDILRLSPGAVVLVAEAVDADMAGWPIQFLRTRFSADRIELRIGQGA